jgi:PKD repeat protein
VAGLTTQGVISPQLNIVLDDDLQNAQLACSPSGRTTAVAHFIADAASKLSGPYSTLLQSAASPLRTYRPPASNTPPIAAFSVFPNPGSAGSSVFFIDGSTDPDGGHIACRSWNFGDPRSGSGNTSADANPTHTYASSGTYTVTLTVTDDDGFATSTTSQTVTIN